MLAGAFSFRFPMLVSFAHEEVNPLRIVVKCRTFLPFVPPQNSSTCSSDRNSPCDNVTKPVHILVILKSAGLLAIT